MQFLLVASSHCKQIIASTDTMKTVLLLFLVVAGASAAKVALSDLTTICDAKSPDLNKCVVNSINKLMPQLAKGIKSYGFPPLDPLKVPLMEIGQDNGPVSLKLTLINTTHTGLSGLKFDDATIDLKNNKWILKANLPHYVLTGKYKGNGKILLVPLIGEGDCEFRLDDVGATMTIDGKPKTEKSEVYFDLTKLSVKFEFKSKTFLSLTNLFSGNKELGERTNQFLNENSGEVLAAMKDTLEDVYSVLYKGLIKRVLDNVPYKQLFLNA